MAAASSRAKSPVGIERFVSKKDSPPVIVCCAAAGDGKAPAQIMNAETATTTRRRMITRLLFLLGHRERPPRNGQRSVAVAAGGICGHRETDGAVSSAGRSVR